MHPFSLEHSKLTYRVDFARYGYASAALAIVLISVAAREQRLEIATSALIGQASWTVIEHALQHFVVLSLPPVNTCPAAHQRRPSALLRAPTVRSAALIAMLVFLPVLLLCDLWRASALTCGVLTGCFGYAATYQAVGGCDKAWINRRKRWHALHQATTRERGRLRTAVGPSSRQPAGRGGP